MPTLEFDLHPDDCARLLRAPAIRGVRSGRAQPSPCRIVWHDTPEGALARHASALAESRDGWRLERIWPTDAEWAPATPPPMLARDAALGPLAPELSRLDAGAGLMPLAAFEGTRRIIQLDVKGSAVSLLLMQGVLRAVAAEQPAAQCTLTGDATVIQGLARSLAGTLRLTVPRSSLAARGRALARGETPPPRRLGAPGVAPGMSVSDALAYVTGYLVDVILHWVPLVTTSNAEEAVHQTRVAVRRLRSALSLFNRAAQGEELDQARQNLKELALRLGPARDWDVFLEGTGTELAASFTEEPRMAALLAAGARRRVAIYAALDEWLARPAPRQLEVELACLAALRRWQPLASPAPEPVAALAEASPDDAPTGLMPMEAHENRLAEPCRDYARRALERRYKRMLHAGEDLASLTVPALHELRKDGKRLRYACEFFAPLFPGKATRRFLRRMEPLQEALGHLNDAAVAASLIRELGNGPARAFAAGAVQGFVAGRAGRLRRRIEAAWDGFRAADAFWD